MRSVLADAVARSQAQGKGTYVDFTPADGRHRDAGSALPSCASYNSPMGNDAHTLPRRERISRRTAVRASVVVIAFVILTNAPYAVAAARTPAGTEFASVIFNHMDQHWYLSVQRSVAEGLDEQNRFTTEERAPVLVSPVYVVMGSVQRVLGLPLLLTYHAFRLLLAASLPVLAFWCFRTAFPSETWTATWATLVALFNVGAGFFFGHMDVGLATRAADLNVPESNSLVTASVFPHITLAHAGVIVLLGSLILATSTTSFKRVGLVAAAGSLMLSLSHVFLFGPFYLTAGALILGTAIHAVLKRQSLRPCLPLVVAPVAAAVVSAPFVLALLDENRRFERLDGRSYPLTPSDAWWTWLTGYGILVPLALAGLAAALAHRRHLRSVTVLLVWIACQVPLLYAFSNFLRRFSEGLVYAIAGLAGLGVEVIRSKLRTSPPRATAALIGFLLPASIVAAGRLGFTGMYLSDGYVGAFSRLHRNDTVLAGDYPSLFLPGRTDARTLVGRDVLTLDWSRKAEERRRFSVEPMSAESLDWLARNDVTAVFIDSNDKSLDLDGARLAAPCFTRVMSTGTVSLYRFNWPCPTPPGPGRAEAPEGQVPHRGGHQVAGAVARSVEGDVLQHHPLDGPQDPAQLAATRPQHDPPGIAPHGGRQGALGLGDRSVPSAAHGP